MASSNGHKSLIDLLPAREFDVKIEIKGQAEPVVIPCRALSYKRYQEIRRLIPETPVPAMGGPRGKIYDTENPEYKQKRTEANEQRNYLCLAEFIQADIPGDSLQDRADWLANNMEMGIVNELLSQMLGTVENGRAAIEGRAATFH